MHQGSAHDQAVLLAVADAAVILAPVHFTGIGGEVRASDLVVDADFRATEAREVAFREIGRRAVVAVGDGVIDALRDVALLAAPSLGQQPPPQEQQRTAQPEISTQAVAVPDGSTLRAIFEEVVKMYAAEKRANEAGEERKEGREELALVAQQDAAKWAFWSMAVACAALLLSAVTFGLILMTFRETKRTADGAIRAATAAEDAVAVSDKTAQRQLRAYVAPASGSILVEDWGATLHATLKAVNNGQTPAYDVNSFINLDVTDADIAEPFPAGGERELVSYMAAEGTYTWDMTRAYTSEEEAAITAGTKRVRLWGEISFVDIFREKTRTFRFRYSMGGAPVILEINGKHCSGWALRPDAQGHKTDD